MAKHGTALDVLMRLNVLRHDAKRARDKGYMTGDPAVQRAGMYRAGALTGAMGTIAETSTLGTLALVADLDRLAELEA